MLLNWVCDCRLFAGGFAGTNVGGTVSNSFWDTGTSGIMTGDIGTGKTTAEMKGLTTFGANDSDWDFGDATQYPSLKRDGSATAGQPCPRTGGCFPFAGGGGTEADPYQISTIAHLNAIRDNSGLSGENYLDDHFVLLNDLDFTGHRYNADDEENAKGWLPIGHDINKDMDGFQGTEFTGSFDGGGYVIRNLSISRGSEDFIGLFGLICLPDISAIDSITNLGLEGVAVEGDESVGGLVGAFYGDGPSRFCYTTGQVTGREQVGGFLGVTDQSTVISCYSTASVIASGTYVGGFVGFHIGRIISSYSTGSVTGSGTYVGGFVGYNEGTIISCYSTGSATGGSSPGGFAGTNDWMVSNSFWDTGTSGIMTGDIGTGKTTAEMKALTAALSGWNALSWDFGDSTQYPAVKSYREDGMGTQLDGYLLCDQPADRAACGVSIAALGTEFPEGSLDNLFVLTRRGEEALTAGVPHGAGVGERWGGGSTVLGSAAGAG